MKHERTKPGTSQKTRKRELSCFRGFVFSCRVFVLCCVFLVAPRIALACPVCFGQNDSPLAKAMNLGIVAMLVVVAGVLGAFASFFIYLMRRAKMVAAKETSEGIAQC